MPDRIVYSQDEIDRIYQKLSRISGRLEQVSGDLRSIRMSSAGGANYSVSGCGTSRLSGFSGITSVRAGSVQSTVSNYASALDRYADHTHIIGTKLQNASGTFVSCEQKLCDFLASASISTNLGTTGGGNDRIFDSIANLLHYPSDRSKWTAAMYQEFMNLVSNGTLKRDSSGNYILTNDDKVYVFDPNGTLRQEITAKSEFDELSYTVKTYDGKGGYTQEEVKGEFTTPKGTIIKYGIDDEDKLWHKESKHNGAYKDGKKLTEEEQKERREVKEVGTLLSVGASYSASGALFEGKTAYKDDHLETEGTVSIVKGQFGASAEAGIYGYTVGKDGKKKLVFSPKVSAEVGGSFSLLSADGSITNDYGFFKNKLSSKVEVGQAEAKASANFGIIDGKFNANAGVSAEANLFKAEVSDKITLGPVDVEGSAAVTVGIGGHAKVGIDDGVVTIDVGASFGLGFEASLKFDTSGLTDFVGDTVNAIGDGIGQVTDAIGDGIGQVTDAVGECFKGAGEAISDFFSFW